MIRMGFDEECTRHALRLCYDVMLVLVCDWYCFNLILVGFEYATNMHLICFECDVNMNALRFYNACHNILVWL